MGGKGQRSSFRVYVKCCDYVEEKAGALPPPTHPPPKPANARARERERVCSTHERYLPTGGNKKHLRSPHPFPRCRQRGRQRHMAVARSVQKFFTVMTFRWSTYMYLPSYLPTYHPLLPLFETKQKNYRIIGVSC